MQPFIKGRYTFLFVSLISLFILNPFLPKRAVGLSILDIFIFAILLSTVFAVHENRKLFVATLLLFFAAIGAFIAAYVTKMIFLGAISIGSYLVFFMTTGVIILKDVLKDEQVTIDKIFGAFCVFLFIGLIWAMAYSLLETLNPGSFNNLPGSPEDFRGYSVGGSPISVFVYYSYITLTTLGYGDITPATRAARSFASLEAIVGQMYLAVLVARLVGLHIAYSGRKDPNSG
ncbi:MAG: hypothetical protein GTN70_01255 [Deltaproteobacteria bacterium]|nr:hypothetical protein [Deltaproteobacteria bacterium]NIS76279.1 hypothetical protein [Deltaproteobacteria bacterium]